MASTASVLPTPTRTAGYRLLGAVVATAALVGAVLAARMLGAGGGGPDGSAVGRAVRTSYGSITVTRVETTESPANEGLGSAHATHDLPKADERGVSVTVRLANVRGTTVAYSPDQFRLVEGRRSVAARTATLSAGALRPTGSVEGTLDFVVPRDARHVWLRWSDPGRSRPLVVDLGALDPRSDAPSSVTHERH